MATVRITYGMAAVRLHFSTKWTNNKPFESRFFCLARCRLLTRSLHHLSFHLFAVFSFTLLPLFLRAKTSFNPICCKSIARFLQVWAVLLCNGRAAFALRSIIGPALIYPYHSVQSGIAQFPLRSSLCRHSLRYLPTYQSCANNNKSLWIVQVASSNKQYQQMKTSLQAMPWCCWSLPFFPSNE